MNAAAPARQRPFDYDARVNPGSIVSSIRLLASERMSGGERVERRLTAIIRG
jgi:hypothetical protein